MVKWLENITDKIAIDDLPEPYKQIAHVVGVKAVLALNENFGGLALYFPRLDKILFKMRNALIRKEFNGINHKALAIKYGLTERWIREIVDHKESELPKKYTASKKKKDGVNG